MPELTSTDTTPQPSTAATMEPAMKQELDHQMQIALNGGVLPTATEPATSTTPTEPAPAAPADPFGVFKEKFGYESPEAAIQEIEALRAFRAAPPAPEWKFENEQSKAIAEALQAGKLDDVYNVLHQQRQIDRLTQGETSAATAAEIIKFSMQQKYPNLKPEQIAWKFNQQYGMPAKPGMLPAEDQEEYDQRIAAWEAQVKDKEMGLMIDAEMLKPELAATKSKLVFPTITPDVDPEFLEYKKYKEDEQRFEPERTQAYKAFAPKSVETKINFKDEPNKIDFEFSFEPDADTFSKAIAMTGDLDLFFKHFANSDGTPNRQAFLKALCFAIAPEKAIMAALDQAKNATIKASLPDNRNGGLVRQMPTTQEPNELDTLMRASLKGYGVF